MRKPLRAAAVFAAAALFVGLNATTSVAATRTWSVSPGGAITGTAPFGILLEDSLLDVPVFGCTSSALKGSLKSGQGLKGGGIATVTSVTFRNCTGQSGTFTITTGKVRWPLTAKYVK